MFGNIIRFFHLAKYFLQPLALTSRSWENNMDSED